MGRRKNSVVKCLEQILTLNYEPQPLHDTCPTLDKVIKSNEMHLFDLSSLQLELERLLTTIMERLACLSAESKGHELPPELMKALHLLTSSNDPDAGQSASGRPSLVVKANPDKPLTLIISQRGRSSQQQQSVLSSLDASIGNRIKPVHTVPYARRTSRSSVDEHAEHSPSSSPDKNQSISYAIPNKFWELMEPYCADITEANIAYLESLIRSYQDMEASYFQLPALHASESVKTEPAESIATKRPKREPTHASSSSTIQHASESTATAPDTISGFASASNIVRLARCLEKELKAPCSESSTLGKLSQSLLNSCYQENIMFAFTEGVERLTADRDTHSAQDNVDEFDKNRPECATITTNTTDWRSSSTPDGSSDTNLTEDGDHDEVGSDPSVHNIPHPYDRPIQSNSLLLPTSLRPVVTSRASQPLKNLAKQMRVSSSYRVEKKIAQAIDELGLFPLNLIHSPSVKPTPALAKPEDYCALVLTNTTTTTTATVCNNNPRDGGTDSQTDQVPIARLKIKASSLKSPLVSHEPASNGPASPASRAGSPTAKRRRKSVGSNKLGSPSANADNVNRLSNGTRWADSETNKSDHSSTVKLEQDAHHDYPVNGVIRTRKSGNHRELKQLRSTGYRGRLRNSLHSPSNAGQHNNACNGSIGEPHNSLPCKTQQAVLSPKSAGEHRLVNGSVGAVDLHPDAVEDEIDENHEEALLANDADDSQSAGNRSRIRSVHSDHLGRSHKSGSESLSSPSYHSNQHHHHLSSRSHHGQPCGAEYPPADQSSKGADGQLTVNGEVFTFDHEDAVMLDEKRASEGRTSGEVPLDAEVCSIRSPTRDHAEAEPGTTCAVKSAEWLDTAPLSGDCDVARDRLFLMPLENKFESDLSFLLNEFALDAERIAKGIPSCDSNAGSGDTASAVTSATRGPALDEVGWAILQRQHELRMVCAVNHSVLRRLVQAARRDVQRQEIQRRLAIADADVIEAYNKLESYRPLRKPPLKRDRDMAYKALKERRKILKELEAFDTCSP